MSKHIERELKIAENEILAAAHKTEREKKQFINELKFGLGEEIKKNPNRPRIIKKTWYQKLSLFLKNIFTRF